MLSLSFGGLKHSLCGLSNSCPPVLGFSRGNGTLAPPPLPVTGPAVEVCVGMPVNRQQSDSSEMDSDVSPSCGLSDLSRGGSLDSRSSSSRSRSLTLVSDCFL